MDTISELFNKNTKLLVMLANTLLVVLMSWSLAQAVLFTYENSNPIQSTSTGKGAQQQRNSQQHFNIEALNLFGNVEQSFAEPTRDAPKTSLNLELQGVFTTEDPSDASAIVATKGKSNGELYHIGDRLPGNATLHGVFDDHVLIKRGSRIEKLSFFENALADQLAPITENRSGSTYSRPKGQQQSASRVQQIRERTAQRQGNPRNQSRANSQGQANASKLKQRLAAYQKRIDQDPQAVLDELGVRRVEGSGANGYRIGSQLSDSALSQTGLRKGDVILAVNGRPVGNIANDQTLIKQAMAAERVSVELMRDGKRMRLGVQIPK